MFESNFSNIVRLEVRPFRYFYTLKLVTDSSEVNDMFFVVIAFLMKQSLRHNQFAQHAPAYDSILAFVDIQSHVEFRSFAR